MAPTGTNKCIVCGEYAPMEHNIIKCSYDNGIYLKMDWDARQFVNSITGERRYIGYSGIRGWFENQLGLYWASPEMKRWWTQATTGLQMIAWAELVLIALFSMFYV